MPPSLPMQPAECIPAPKRTQWRIAGEHAPCSDRIEPFRWQREYSVCPLLQKWVKLNMLLRGDGSADSRCVGRPILNRKSPLKIRALRPPLKGNDYSEELDFTGAVLFPILR